MFCRIMKGYSSLLTAAAGKKPVRGHSHVKVAALVLSHDYGLSFVHLKM
jgi:hypothetical protein